MAVHHPHKSGLSAECIWKQHVRLCDEGGRLGLRGGRGGRGVGAKSWASSIRQSSSSIMIISVSEEVR